MRRFRSLQLELGERLVAFRARYGVTQTEAARAVGTDNASTVSLWESGVNVPDGMLRERLADLLDGRRWPELRAAMLGVTTDGLPDPWDRAVRWYRRASRERRPRETEGAAVAAVLSELRGVTGTAELLGHYRGRDGDWVTASLDQLDPGEGSAADLRRVEEAAYGLRWLELAHGLTLQLDRSLVPQLPAGLPAQIRGRCPILTSTATLTATASRAAGYARASGCALGTDRVFGHDSWGLSPPGAPVDAEEARLMRGELRGAARRGPFRGRPAADVAAAAEVIARVSQPRFELPEIRRLDLNPALVGAAGEGRVAADALAVV